MNCMAKIGVLGDRDSVLLFKSIGLDVFFAADAEEASKQIHQMARDGYSVIFITEQLYTGCAEAMDRYREQAFPSIVPVPGISGTTGVGMEELKRNVEKAIGADILFSEGR